MTPGVELLTAIGAQAPAFRLTGDTLAEQGGVVTGMLASGWTARQVCDVVAGEPLPVPIRTSTAAVIAWRLRQATRGPAPAAVPRIPGPASGGDGPGHQEHGGRGGGDGPTPVPEGLAAKLEQIEAAVYGGGPMRDCAEIGERGACKKLAVRGEDRCAEHLGWPLCPVCGAKAGRRVRPGEQVCDTCGADGPAADGQLAALLARAAEQAAQDDYYDSGQFDRDAQGTDAPF